MWRQFSKIWDVLILIAIPVYVPAPWLFGWVDRYNADPGEWLEHIGISIALIGWAGGSRLYDFLMHRVRDTRALQWPFLIIMGASALIGTPLALFGDWFYAQGRYQLQQAEMVRYAEGEGACPGVRCLRDPSGVLAIAWGENDRAWTGACYDPDNVVPPLAVAGRADYRARRPAVARLFGGEPRRSIPLRGDWIRCSVVYRDLPDPRDS